MAPTTPSNSGKSFKPRDLVFAKLRGYPAWPARVESVAQSSASPKNAKYNIFFFGTYQTAKCTGDQMWHFEESLEKFGKFNKAKGFQEGMEEIKHNPSLVVTAERSFPESSKKEEDSPSSSKTTQPSSKEKKKKPIAEASTGSVGTEAKTPKGKAQAKAPIDDESEDEAPPKKTSKVRSPSGKSPLTVVYPALKSSRKDKAAVATTESRVKKEINIPHHKTLEGEVQVQLTRQQILHLLSLDNLPHSLRAKLEQHTMEKFVAATETQEIREKQEFLRTELQLMIASRALDKIFSGDNPPDLERGLQLLDELNLMPVNYLMLKKQPTAVELVAKLTRYKGSTKLWNLTSKEQDIFQGDVRLLRDKSGQTLNRFVHLCEVPPNVPDFLTWFQEQAKLLRTIVSGQNFVLMTQAPIVVELETSDDEDERMEPTIQMARGKGPSA